MLGRKTFTRSEFDNARADVARLVKAYRRVVKAAGKATDAPEVTTALESLEPQLFNTAILALDRRFVHRVRAVAGKDSNPLNEVELVAEALVENEGVFPASRVLKYSPPDSILGLDVGDRVELSRSDFEKLVEAFLADLEEKFV